LNVAPAILNIAAAIASVIECIQIAAQHITNVLYVNANGCGCITNGLPAIANYIGNIQIAA
jgi:hypothetical protein